MYITIMYVFPVSRSDGTRAKSALTSLGAVLNGFPGCERDANGASTQYSYDATGNRTSKTIGGTSYSNTVQTTSNRLTQTQDVNGTATLQYDAAGHITNDGTNSFTYSDRGRMTSATNAGGDGELSVQRLRAAGLQEWALGHGPHGSGLLPV
jgi:hypothetical protein